MSTYSISGLTSPARRRESCPWYSVTAATTASPARTSRGSSDLRSRPSVRSCTSWLRAACSSAPRDTGTDPWLLNHYAYANNNPVRYVDPSGEISILGTLKAVAIVANVVTIAIPTYQLGSSVRELLDQADFVQTLRSGLNAGWLPFGDFLEMHQRARILGTHMAARVTQSIFDFARAVLDTTSYGQITSWVQLGGSAANMAWSVVNDSNGDVTGTIEIGDATAYWKRAWHVANSTIHGARAGHHLIPKAALRNIEVSWGLFRRKSLKNWGGNLVNMNADAHERLHALMRQYGPPKIAPEGDMNKIIKGAGGADQYLDYLADFYRSISDQPEFKDIYIYFQAAREHIGASNIVT